MAPSHVGLIGLGAMGSGIAASMARSKFRVSVS
ncbi:MAG: NAD(P)-dependent oxidoreductase, partial [Alphaproteobacteria bacterium]|nr:NAD(P)-dependent oxidoreductase [Alphaproteobacteria bacterium]